MGLRLMLRLRLPQKQEIAYLSLVTIFKGFEKSIYRYIPQLSEPSSKESFTLEMCQSAKMGGLSIRQAVLFSGACQGYELRWLTVYYNKNPAGSENCFGDNIDGSGFLKQAMQKAALKRERADGHLWNSDWYYQDLT